MISKIDFNPNWISLPGNTINDILDQMNMSHETFARKLGVNDFFIEKLLNGQLQITSSIAENLSRILGTSTEFWINRQEQYHLFLNEIQSRNEKAWLKQLPIADMLSLGWISQGENLVETCLKFFETKNIHTWQEKYSNLVSQTAFRTSQAFQTELGAVAAWLRQGEIIADSIRCENWNENQFLESLVTIRKLTKKKQPKDFLTELINICSESGVAVSIVRTPRGCHASGATKFLNHNKALLQLSFRYLSDDQFWFSFFHEAGHLVLHNKKNLFIESIDDNNSLEESEANSFAGELLIPHDLHSELATLRGNKRKIISFAMKAGVSPGIVIGQLQHYGYIDRSYLNGYKRRYDWGDIF